jgi:hypothetical protein
VRKRKLLVVLAGLAALLVTAGVFVLWPRPPLVAWEVHLANYRRISPGLTMEQVHALLGAPGDYRAWPTRPGLGENETLAYTIVSFLEDPTETWQYDSATIRVDFDHTLHSSAKLIRHATPVELNPLDRLRWLAKRQWHRWFT